MDEKAPLALEVRRQAQGEGHLGLKYEEETRIAEEARMEAEDEERIIE